MPSPFPGMDPYLEGHYWTVVHHELGSAIPRQLSPRLRPKYVALPIERFIRDESLFERTAGEYPDVGISRGLPLREAAVVNRAASGGDVPLQLATLISEPIPHVSVEIYAAFIEIYESLNFDLAVDYTKPPDVPLTGEAELWADEWLRRAGVRK